MGTHKRSGLNQLGPPRRVPTNTPYISKRWEWHAMHGPQRRTIRKMQAPFVGARKKPVSLASIKGASDLPDDDNPGG